MNTRHEISFEPPLSRGPAIGWIGIEKNKPHQSKHTEFKSDNFRLVIVEFDDQGRCFDRAKMHDVENLLKGLEGKNPIIAVFVHGWKHNARHDDQNLRDFCRVLDNTGKLLTNSGSERDVVGIFVGWRGKSFYCPGAIELTFWDRKLAGLRVAMGATRELFERLRQFRTSQVHAGHSPVFVAIGHSFGGLVVYSALAQSLISAAITPGNAVVPSFANLVLLVNPAFEAVRYLPIHDLVVERERNSLGTEQPPVFVSVTAENDSGTGFWFPAGMIFSRIQESAIGPEEATAVWHTLGHVPFLQTHRLEADETGKNGVLYRTRFSERNPFWVVSASRKVVDDHNGIWQDDFIDWVTDLIAKQMSGPQTPQLYTTRLASPTQNAHPVANTPPKPGKSDE